MLGIVLQLAGRGCVVFPSFLGTTLPAEIATYESYSILTSNHQMCVKIATKILHNLGFGTWEIEVFHE